MRILSIMTVEPSDVGPPSEAEIEQMGKLIEEMRTAGVLVDTGGRMPGQFEATVRRKNGRITVSDGPFSEAKEVVGGYALFEVEDREAAIAWTNRFLDLVGDATCHLHEVSQA